jgi:putative ABC transport system substrate-binding protein
MTILRVTRRAFIAGLGGAAAWPVVARGQQPAMPVVGYLGNNAPDDATSYLVATFRQGLKETGYVEGQNVIIEYRLANYQYDRLPKMAADLVRRQVSVIAVPGSNPGALAAKAATKAIPIIFGVTDDPVKVGLVASLARPGGNATGVNFLSAELAAKRLGLMRELVPGAARIAVLVNPTNAVNTEAIVKDVEAAARAIGLQIHVLNASTASEIDAAFATLAGERADALFVAPDALFVSRRVELATLAARYAIPAAYSVRDYAEAGGLMSYGTSLTEVFRQVGVYAGRILKGEKPSDLPVLQSTKFELVINLKTAKALGLEIPPQLLARADEVIE